MTTTTKNKPALQLIFTILVASAITLVMLSGCESEDDTSSSTSGTTIEFEVPDVFGSDGTESPVVPTGQTAPMPDNAIQESEILGCWSPDVNAQQPIFIDFFYKDGKLSYDYYQMVLGDGSGFGIGNGHSKFEYNNGEVVFHGNQGTCLCLATGSNNAYIAFYLDSISDGVIYDQEDGKPFYYVGSQCPIDGGSSARPSGTPSSSSISSPDEAINYLYGLLVNAGREVPSHMEYDHMSGDGYVIHGYEDINDGNGSHTATWFWYTVYPDGTVYDEILMNEVMF